MKMSKEKYDKDRVKSVKGKQMQTRLSNPKMIKIKR